MSQGSDDGNGDCLLGHSDPGDCPHTNGNTIRRRSERDKRIGLEVGGGSAGTDAGVETSEGPATVSGHTRCPVCGDQIPNALLDG